MFGKGVGGRQSSDDRNGQKTQCYSFYEKNTHTHAHGSEENIRKAYRRHTRIPQSSFGRPLCRNAIIVVNTRLPRRTRTDEPDNIVIALESEVE